MEIRSYNAELAYANLLFSRIFRNIVLERTVKNQKKEFQVNCVFGQRSRILKNLQNPDKRATMKLPLIVINRTGITRNAERLNNLHNEVKYQESSKRRNYNLYTPVPIDISYDVYFIAKFPGDIDKIISNFIAFFNADLFVTCIHPKYEGIKFNNQIIMQDSISEESLDELDATQDDFKIVTFQFTYKTYIFSGPDKSKYGTNLIPKISSYISTWTEVSGDISVEMSAQVSTEVEVIYDGFVPQINAIDIGFYAVPKEKDFIEYMDYVDTLSNYDPYVDRFIWKIDGASEAEFPYNVGWYRKNELSSAGF